MAAGRDAGTVGLEFGEGGDWHVPRGMYGQYIRDTVKQELAVEAGTGVGPGATTVRVVRGEVVAVDTVKQTPTARAEGGALRVEVVLSSSGISDISNNSNSSDSSNSSNSSSSGTRSVINPDHVVLCTGNLPPRRAAVPGF